MPSSAECSRDKPPFSFVRGQDSTMWDIIWIFPQGHRSVSVSRHFLLQAPQCPCSVRKRWRMTVTLTVWHLAVHVVVCGRRVTAIRRCERCHSLCSYLSMRTICSIRAPNSRHIQYAYIKTPLKSAWAGFYTRPCQHPMPIHQSIKSLYTTILQVN